MMLNKRTAIYTDINLKRALKKHSNILGLSMSEYLRYLLKINLAENYTDKLTLKYKNKMEAINYMKDRIKRGNLWL